jgi:hypothetical protein
MRLSRLSDNGVLHPEPPFISRPTSSIKRSRRLPSIMSISGRPEMKRLPKWIRQPRIIRGRDRIAIREDRIFRAWMKILLRIL